MLLLLLLVVSVHCYEQPIIINTEIDYNCNFDVYQKQNLILTSNENNILLWNVNGELVNKFVINLDKPDDIMCVRANDFMNEIIVTMLNSSIYFYDMQGNLNKHITPFNNDNDNYNFQVINKKTGYLYVLTFTSDPANILAYDPYHLLISNTTLNKDIQILPYFSTINELNNDLIMGIGVNLTYPLKINIMNISGETTKQFNLFDGPPAEIFFINNTYIGVYQYRNINLYRFDGTPIKTIICNKNNQIFSIGYYEKFDYIYYLQKNASDITIVIRDTNGNMINQLYYGTFNSGVNSYNVKILESDGTIIANSGNEIKIWRNT